MEEEKKKGKGSLIVIILLIIVILGLVGYIIFNGDGNIGFTKNNSKSVEDKNTKTSDVVEKTDNWKDISLTDERFYNIYTILKKFTHDRSRGAGSDDFTYDELSMIAFATANYNGTEYTETGKNQSGRSEGILDISNLDGALESIFGKSVFIDFSKATSLELYNLNSYNLKLPNNFPEQMKICGFEITSYDKANKKINISGIDGCGGVYEPKPNISDRKIISAKISNDLIVVEEKAIYLTEPKYYNPVNNEYKNVSYTIYSNYSKSKLIDAKTFNTDNDITKEEIKVDDYLDKASTITHTFKLNKNTNKYYFVSSVIK